MKKNILITATLLMSLVATAQTATDFTATDCLANSHNLYSELNSGKVIVIAWVMPCTSCIGPSLAAYNASESFSTSNPGQVFFYLADDLANTSCASLTSWGNTNSMPNAIKFSSALVNQTGYGTAGMPKIVVLGGSSHTIYYNQNSGVTTSAVQTAISSALSTASVNEMNSEDIHLNLFPNPAQNKAKFEYVLSIPTEVSVSIYNVLGAEVKNIQTENQQAGKHESIIELESLTAGIYFFKIKVGGTSKVIKFSVVN